MEPRPEAGPLAPVQLPRITISFCTQCKWMLRAAYFAQELLSTFSTSLGEVSLIPGTGGVFTIDILYRQPGQEAASGKSPTTQTARLWDRKAEGGFPEVKNLKQLVRNIIDPLRDLGHVDRDHNGKKPGSTLDEGTYMSTVQSFEGKAKESIQQHRQTLFTTDNLKLSKDHQEQTIATDADAAVARAAALEKSGKQGTRKENEP